MTTNERQMFEPVIPEFLEKVRKADNKVLKCAYGKNTDAVTLSKEEAKIVASQITMLADLIRSTLAPKIFASIVKDEARLAMLQSVFAGTVCAVFKDDIIRTELQETEE